jgi:glycosyltransferase involved in cell wall biosynthesis
MATLVEDGVTGLLFQPGDAADLAAKLAWADAHPAEMQRMGDQARRHYEAELTGPANLRQLQAIYSEALALHGAASPAPGKP